MGKIHFIGGEKGGVGKSFVSRLLAQYFIDSNKPFVGFDTDRSHQTFSRFYGDFTDPVSTENFTSLDQIIDAAENSPSGNLIIDLAAQTAGNIDRWIHESDLFGIMQELNYEIFFWHVMDDGADSVFLLEKQLTRYVEKPVQWVIVENFGRGKSFKNFEASNTYQQAKLQNAKFLLIGNLQEDLTQKIDFNNASFWAAANNKDKMKIAERHRVNVWLNFCYAQIEKAIEQENRVTLTLAKSPAGQSVA